MRFQTIPIDLKIFRKASHTTASLRAPTPIIIQWKFGNGSRTGTYYPLRLPLYPTHHGDQQDQFRMPMSVPSKRLSFPRSQND